MKLSSTFAFALPFALTFAAPSTEKRAEAGFGKGQPLSADGKGGPILGGTNKQIDLQNPDGLGQQKTDAGFVPNAKWSLSDSKTRIFQGGWVREQVLQDLPRSTTISGAQQHLKKGGIRELHWHRVAEWGIVYAGEVILSVVDEDGGYQTSHLKYGDIWYFPKGIAHTIQGVKDENEYLLIFDDGDFEAVGTTFNLDDWLIHTPVDVLAKNFGVDKSVFGTLPSPNPYIVNGTLVNDVNITDGSSSSSSNKAEFDVDIDLASVPEPSANNSYVYRLFDHQPESIGGKGGTFYKIDSTNFPIATTIATTFVTLKPGALRELHWHPNAEEWLYFHKGQGRATVFIGNSASRTFDFRAGDIATFPDNSGHYIENTGKEDLVWIEAYRSDKVQDISLAQWLSLTPPHIVSQVLKVPLDFAKKLKKEKQVLIA